MFVTLPSPSFILHLFLLVVFSFSAKSNARKNRIKKAMDELSSLSCILFVPRTNQTAYIEFFKGKGCLYIITFIVKFDFFSYFSWVMKKFMLF